MSTKYEYHKSDQLGKGLLSGANPFNKDIKEVDPKYDDEALFEKIIDGVKQNGYPMLMSRRSFLIPKEAKGDK